jgi:alpha-amylase/alpha-mannosidase (GH57 family)
MKRVRLALLWHMHQPLYREPERGEYLLPWVRLHATRSYNDMAWILERHPEIRCTVNFVPVLLEQLADYAAGRARDRFLELTLRPAADLGPAERQAILRSFFMVDWEANVQPLPRYAELLQKRGRDVRHADMARLSRSFSEAELADLQVLFNLTWMGFGAQADEPVVQALRRKGRDFTHQDREELVAAQQRVLSGIVPRWRALAERGQVELATTPYYHPILPLVCDTDAARRALPDVVLPPRFAHPEDARWQVRAARESHARWFGSPPAGMWPAEGSVSPEAVEVLASEGVRWAASDEGVLLRSLPEGASRVRSLYRPWRVEAGAGGEIDMLFRDRPLSDLVGFTYAKVPARQAAKDFETHVRAVGEAWTAEHQPGPATLGVFLDGENAWEHYPASGHEFLDRLHGTLASSREIETVTMSQAVADAPGPAIPRIHSGSWIESSFRIWIGHAEDRRAWTALGKAREQVEAAARAGRVDPETLERARRHLYAAEGSDWFWWYGEDFTNELAAEFDALFRGNVIQASLLLGASPPAEVQTPIKAAGEPGSDVKVLREPTLLVTPALDGRETTYFEWQGAGLYRPGQHRGSMFGGAQGFHVLCYGFDLEALVLRLDPAESPQRSVEVASRLEVELAVPAGRIPIDFELVPDGQPRAGRRQGGEVGQIAFLQVVEIRIPFRELGLVAGTRVAVCVRALRADVEVERLPRFGFVEFTVPDRDFERLNWRV